MNTGDKRVGTHDVRTVYEVKTSRGSEFWVLAATSPGRAIAKLKREGRARLDRGERITASAHVGTIDIL